jgi:hypothetical protein
MKSVERFADRKMRETYPDYVSQRDVVLEPVGLSENDLSYLPLSEYEVSSARASAYAAKAQQLELERGLFLSSYKKIRGCSTYMTEASVQSLRLFSVQRTNTSLLTPPQGASFASIGTAENTYTTTQRSANTA